MLTIIINVVIIFLLTIANGIFAMSEIAIFSARRSRLQQLADEGDANARSALKLANEPGRFLSTVQMGITLIATFAGAFGGTTIADQLASTLARIPAIAQHSHSIALAIVVVGVTYLSLVIGELVPKRLALHDPERIASIMAKPMRLLSLIGAPAVKVLSASTDVVLKLLRVHSSQSTPVGEEEIRLLIRQGAQAGLFEKEEQEMVERVLRLDIRRAGTLMCPRSETAWLDIDDPLDEIRRKIIESGHSRFPVCRGDLDNVLGIVQAKDLLVRYLSGKPIKLKDMLHYPLFVFENLSALQLLKTFRKARASVALVVDEYGSIEGMVTINDVLEAIVGDIASYEEEGEPEAVQREDGSWLLDGALPFDDFKEIFNIKELPGEEKAYYHTVAGFVLMHLGHIPATGEHFEWEGFRFEVVDMDGHRVDKLLVMPLHLDQQ